MVLALFLLFTPVSAFLLEGHMKHTSTSLPVISDKHYNMVMDLLNEERQYRIQLEQKIQLQEQDLRNTKEEVTLKVQELEAKYRSKESGCADLDNKTEGFQNEIHILQSSYEQLKLEYSNLQQKNTFYESRIQHLEQQFNALKNLTAVANMQTVLDVKNETTKLEHTVQNIRTRLDQVTVEAVVRKQDFLALYAKTIQTEERLENKSVILDERWNELNNRVILMAYVTSTKDYRKGEVIIFNDTRVSKGLRDITTFTNSGVFTCEKHGIYQIAAYLQTRTSHACHYIVRNGQFIGSACSSLTDFYETNTEILIVELHVNDTIAVKCYNDFHVYGHTESGFSILQLQ